MDALYKMQLSFRAKKPFVCSEYLIMFEHDARDPHQWNWETIAFNLFTFMSLWISSKIAVTSVYIGKLYRRLYAVPDYSYAGHFEMEFKFDVPQCSKTPNLLWREPKRIVNQFLEALEFKSF